MVSSEQLGQINFNEELGWFEARVELGERKVEVYLNVGTEEELEPLLPAAERIVGDIELLNQEAKDGAVRELLTSKNESWLDEGEEPLSDTEFHRRIRLESIIVYSDASSEWFYNDDDIFWDHTIIAALDADHNFVEASLAG